MWHRDFEVGFYFVQDTGMSRVGRNHIYTVYIRYFGREITKYTVTYGVYIYGSGHSYSCLIMTDTAHRPVHCTVHGTVRFLLYAP